MDFLVFSLGFSLTSIVSWKVTHFLGDRSGAAETIGIKSSSAISYLVANKCLNWLLLFPNDMLYL